VLTRDIELAAQFIRRGDLVAFPTETVYGLGARVSDTAAICRIFEAKNRPLEHPLIAHVLGEDDAKSLAAEWPASAHALARAFWPGPLTLVVPRASHVPDVVTAGLDSIAVRAPSNAIARALIEKVGEPIVAPSANRHQAISPTCAEHVDLDVLVLDGGPCDKGIESTVVDVRTTPARILRPGPISLDAIAKIVDVEVANEIAIGARRSPGMSERHYAPRATLLVAGSDDEAKLLVAIHGATLLELPDDPDAAAHELYARLHSLDEKKTRIIVIRNPPENEAWRAIRDRIQRASRPKR